MKTKSNRGFIRTHRETIITKACRTVPGFDDTCRKFEQQLVLQLRSHNALQYYSRSLAKLAIHFGIDTFNPPELMVSWKQFAGKLSTFPE